MHALPRLRCHEVLLTRGIIINTYYYSLLIISTFLLLLIINDYYKHAYAGEEYPQYRMILDALAAGDLSLIKRLHEECGVPISFSFGGIHFSFFFLLFFFFHLFLYF